MRKLGQDDSRIEDAPDSALKLTAVRAFSTRLVALQTGAEGAINDDVATVETLTAYREAMTKLISQHRGRVVDSPGDNLLAEFSSVVAAVQCSVGIQGELTERNADLCRLTAAWSSGLVSTSAK